VVFLLFIFLHFPEGWWDIGRRVLFVHTCREVMEFYSLFCPQPVLSVSVMFSMVDSGGRVPHLYLVMCFVGGSRVFGALSIPLYSTGTDNG